MTVLATYHALPPGWDVQYLADAPGLTIDAMREAIQEVDHAEQVTA